MRVTFDAAVVVVDVAVAEVVGVVAAFAALGRR